MTLKQIQAFYWASTLGNFVIAAERLHITQSTLSKRLFELEAVVGAQLFDRSGKHARLTEAGHRLMKRAAQMLELSELMLAEAQSVGDLTGICRFGITELGSLSWLPTFISRARLLYPHLTFQPYVDLAQVLERMVFRGELDCAVAPAAGQDPMLSLHKVCEVDCGWMAAPSRIAQGAIVTMQALQALPVITMTEGSGMTGSLSQWALRQGVRLNHTLASNSMMAIVGLTAADIGVSYLPRLFMEPWVRHKRLVSFHSDPPTPNLSYYFVHRRDDRRELVGRIRDLVFSEAGGVVGGQWASLEGPGVIQKRNDKRVE